MDSTMIHTLRRAAALRRKWNVGQEASLLGWVTSIDPAVAEVEAEWGYDGLIIDTEHATFDPPALRGVLMAFRGTDCVPIVRVTANDPALIKIALDLGAGGVLIPLVDDAAAAQAAVAACRYAPEGRRGVAPRRAGNYNRDAVTYLAEANSSLIVMVQIESVTAYRNLDEILAVPGIDCCFIGPADLSATLGHLDDVRHPEVVQVILDIIRRCRQANRAVAIAEGIDAKHVKRWLDAGITAVSCGADLGFMQSGFAAFKASVKDEIGISFP
ncbi:MAG: aldolase/citrate lyase family protein [Anaerolineae bacterium]|nr:aldolase/citrate lyase family protein [Anaerolineae bacterium]